jgi:hypothetical protein
MNDKPPPLAPNDMEAGSLYAPEAVEFSLHTDATTQVLAGCSFAVRIGKQLITVTASRAQSGPLGPKIDSDQALASFINGRDLAIHEFQDHAVNIATQVASLLSAVKIG